jgi:hypothetical protein
MVHHSKEISNMQNERELGAGQISIKELGKIMLLAD